MSNRAIRSPGRAVNRVRIIGGAWRRRMLVFPDGEGLRPTPDRVRETLFNWLGQTLDGTDCLDLFAGSGALGFEAASRGAARVVMVERSASVFAALEENLIRLDAKKRVELFNADALEFAAASSGAMPFDLLFVDPPYRQDWLERLTPLLPRLLKGTGRLYLEAEFPVPALGAWQTVRAGRAGQVHFHLLEQA
jgi:16S rRNA (guanine966-N2)-methyltransferase